MNIALNLVFALLLPLAPLYVTGAENMDVIVAVVNDDVITRAELDQDIALILNQLRSRGTPIPPRSVIEHQVLERMIGKRLQLQAAERLGLQVDDATLSKAIGNIAAKNHLTLEELRAALERDGVKFSQFRDETRTQLLLARLQAQEVVNRITVTDQEVELFLQRNRGKFGERAEVHLQHILVATPDGADALTIQRAREKVERILAQLQQGADFAQMALIYSDGRQALEGGDLGWLKLSQVPSLAAEVARSLKTGEFSAPLHSASGWHLFRVAEVRGGERLQVTQTHARHILIRTNELVSDAEARTRLEQLRLRLVGGENFEVLARAHSDDTSSAIKGGDLGWLNPGDTVPLFEEQMQALSPNELSQPFHSPFGWHLLQVLERRNYDNTEEVLKNKARDSLRARKAEEANDLWLRRLRDESYVEIRLDA